MNKERIVGLFFSITSLLVLLFFVLTPQIDYQQEFKVFTPEENTQNVNQVVESFKDKPLVGVAENIDTSNDSQIYKPSANIEISPINLNDKLESIKLNKIEKETELVNKNIESKLSNISESDFDLFVIRVHVLSSKENALNMVTKINEGGFPSFTETFGSKKDLHAVYVGPFLEEDDIKDNISLIQKVSESKNGEVSRWKL